MFFSSLSSTIAVVVVQYLCICTVFSHSFGIAQRYTYEIVLGSLVSEIDRYSVMLVYSLNKRDSLDGYEGRMGGGRGRKSMCKRGGVERRIKRRSEREKERSQAKIPKERVNVPSTYSIRSVCNVMMCGIRIRISTFCVLQDT